MPVPADFLDPLRHRLARLTSDAQVEAALQTALVDSGFRTLAALDASARMVQALIDAQALSRHDAEAALAALFRQAQAERDQELIPSPYWRRGAGSRVWRHGDPAVSGIV